MSVMRTTTVLALLSTVVLYTSIFALDCDVQVTPDYRRIALAPGEERVDTVRVYNRGTGSIMLEYTGGDYGSSSVAWWTIDLPPLGFVIAAGDSAIWELRINPDGIINPLPGTSSVLEGVISFSFTSYSCNGFSVDLLVVVGDVSPPIYLLDTIATSCTRLVVRNDGNIGVDGQGKVNLDYWYSGDCDTLDSVPGNTSRYLYSATPVIIQGVSTPIVNASWAGFGPNYLRGNNLAPVVDTVPPITSFGRFSGPGYTAVRSGLWVTSDSAVAGERTVFAPTASVNCNFVIVVTKLYSYRGVTVPNLTVSELVNFTIPSDSDGLNEIRFDDFPSSVYQNGVETPSKDALECSGGNNENNQRRGGIRFIRQGLHCTWEPVMACWAREMEGFQDYGLLLKVDSLWTLGQYSQYDIPEVPAQANWLVGMNLWEGLSLGANDTLKYVYALATQRSGTETEFLALLEKASVWFNDNESAYLTLGCGYNECCCVGSSGNADGSLDDMVDIADLQFYIDYLFFFGPESNCKGEFDTAGIDRVIDISDLQVIIDYLFFGQSLRSCYMTPEC